MLLVHLHERVRVSERGFRRDAHRDAVSGDEILLLLREPGGVAPADEVRLRLRLRLGRSLSRRRRRRDRIFDRRGHLPPSRLASSSSSSSRVPVAVLPRAPRLIEVVHVPELRERVHDPRRRVVAIARRGVDRVLAEVSQELARGPLHLERAVEALRVVRPRRKPRVVVVVAAAVYARRFGSGVAHGGVVVARRRRKVRRGRVVVAHELEFILLIVGTHPVVVAVAVVAVARRGLRLRDRALRLRRRRLELRRDDRGVLVGVGPALGLHDGGAHLRTRASRSRSRSSWTATRLPDSRHRQGGGRSARATTRGDAHTPTRATVVRSRPRRRRVRASTSSSAHASATRRRSSASRRGADARAASSSNLGAAGARRQS
eukprot:28708-Pelagococcus_subviridis.AAC.1